MYASFHNCLYFLKHFCTSVCSLVSLNYAVKYFTIYIYLKRYLKSIENKFYNHKKMNNVCTRIYYLNEKDTTNLHLGSDLCKLFLYGWSSE